MSLDVELGLGLEIPTDTDLGIDNEAFQRLGEDSWEWDQEIRKTYPLLTLEQGYSSEFTTGAAIFVKRTQDNGYYANATIELSELELTRDEEAQLRAFAADFNVDYQPKIIAIPSYG